MSYHDPDHVRKALLRHLDADRDKPVIEELTRVLVDRYQQIEDALWDMRQNLSLARASGYSLDRIGAIVGEPRRNRPDDVYRLWIAARGLANRSGGTVDEILTILRLVLGEDAQISYADVTDRDAEAYFTAIGYGPVIDIDQVSDILRDVAPAGVQLELTGSEHPPEDTFGFAGGPGAGFGVGHFAGLL